MGQCPIEAVSEVGEHHREVARSLPPGLLRRQGQAVRAYWKHVTSARAQSRSRPTSTSSTRAASPEDTTTPAIEHRRTWREPRDTDGHAWCRFWDRAPEGGRGPDSQADSHSVGHWQPLTNVSGPQLTPLHLGRTSPDSGGCQKRGLQNREGSSADVCLSSLSSTNIHRCRRLTANDSQLVGRLGRRLLCTG